MATKFAMKRLRTSWLELARSRFLRYPALATPGTVTGFPANPAGNSRLSRTIPGLRACRGRPRCYGVLVNANTRTLLRGRLEVRVFADRGDAGAAGAEIAAGVLREETRRAGRAAVVFASAVSQGAFLAALRAQQIDWTRIIAFHMDEYAGMSGDHPASFRRFLRERLLDHVPVAAFHQLEGDAADAEAECARYAGLLRMAQPCLAIMGIGENGHVAFIDPPVCDFSDPRDVRAVELDDFCRMQQVHDGAFARLEDVPRRALSLTVPFFLRVPRAFVFVNGVRKSAAVRAALEGPVVEACPASVLRRHPCAILFLDEAAVSLL